MVFTYTQIFIFICTIIACTVGICFELGVSISKVMISENIECKSEYQISFPWIFIACMTHIFDPIVIFYNIRRRFTNTESVSLKDDMEQNIKSSQITQLTITIGSAITYFYAINSCYDSPFTSKAPELWIYVIIHFAMFWIYAGYMVLSLVVSSKDTKTFATSLLASLAVSFLCS